MARFAERLAIGPPGVEVDVDFDGQDGTVRVRGATTFQEAVNLGTAVMNLARERGVRRLLMDLVHLQPDHIPSLAERYFMARDWAAAGAGAIKLAMVVRRELIDPQKFSVLAARNAGLVGDVFTEEQPAREWLSSA